MLYSIPSELMCTVVLPSLPTNMKKLGATNHVMLGAGMLVATQVRMAGLLSFATKVSAVISTPGDAEQEGERDVHSHFP